MQEKQKHHRNLQLKDKWRIHLIQDIKIEKNKKIQTFDLTYFNSER